MLALDDTIAAIASTASGAARGIVRLSGPTAIEVVTRCFKSANHAVNVSEMRSARLVTGEINAGGPRLPVDLYLWPTRQSFTRQPIAEIHTFGSTPILEIIVRALCTAGARLAQPGEFTMRAFLAGRIDLMQAEAVLGVIDATDRRHLDTALSQLAGGLSRPLQRLRDDLLNLLADLEAGLDFVEDDIRFIAPDELARRLSDAAEQLHTLTRQLVARGVGNRLPKVALVGLPNVGKSSLFNALKRTSDAIVSPVPGTTRDYLVAQIDAAGLAVELIDTAGLMAEIVNNDPSLRVRSSDAISETQINTIAQLASTQQYQQADLRLLCFDSTQAIDNLEVLTNPAQNTLVVLTKCDQTPHPEMQQAPGIRTSSQSGLGLNQLLFAIRKEFMSKSQDAGAVGGSSMRISESLKLATASIEQAGRLSETNAGDEFIAADVRSALTELGKIVGAIYTDDLLDRIFSRFCIGK